MSSFIFVKTIKKIKRNFEQNKIFLMFYSSIELLNTMKLLMKTKVYLSNVFQLIHQNNFKWWDDESAQW